MYKNKNLASALSIVVLASSMACGARDTSDRVWDAGLAIVGIGAAAVVGAGIWGACQPAKPEDVLDDALRTHDRVKHQYGHLANKFCSVSIRSMSEAALYELALAKIPAQCVGVSASIAEVQSAQSAARDAVCRAERYEVRRDLEKCIQKLDVLKADVAKIDDCLSYHRAYFELFNLEDSLMAYHVQELGALGYNVEACDYAREGIRTCLGRRVSQLNGWKYPYLKYAQKIANDIEQLERAIAAACSAHAYHARLNAARDLLRRLQALQHVVVTDSEYTRSFWAQEHEQRERERMELERQRFRLEQERVRIEQARLQAERDHQAQHMHRAYCSVCGMRQNGGCIHICC